MPLEWVAENASRLTLLPAQPLTLSPCGKAATRSILAIKDGCSEQVGDVVRYDLPAASGEDADAAKLRRETHRLREKAIIRALDGDAADEHRAKRTQQRRDERGEEDAVAAVVQRLISTVERRANPRRWRCPGGCAHDDPTCARATFRRQCVPTWRSNRAWDNNHYTAQYEYQAKLRKFKVDGEKVTEEDFRAAHAVTEDMRDQFLDMWDGMIEPIFFWDPTAATCGDRQIPDPATEFLGYRRRSVWGGFDGCGREDHWPAELRALNGSDQFDDYIYPVGQAACARRRCAGCCYCRAQPSLPVRFAVREFLPSGCCHLSRNGRYAPLGERVLVLLRAACPTCAHQDSGLGVAFIRADARIQRSLSRIV